MAFSEKEVQNHLWSIKDKWTSILDVATLPDDEKVEDMFLYAPEPQSLIANVYARKLRKVLEIFTSLEIISSEIGLPKDQESTIRCDFLGVQPGAPGIAIIELKKEGQTERQAFTELLAYASHLTTLFPAFCNDDLIYILIAPFETRIVREAYANTLLYKDLNILGLQYYFTDDSDITTIRLKVVLPELQDYKYLSKATFNLNNFDVQKVVWQDHEDWNAEKQEDPSHHMISRMNIIAAMAAQEMERKNIHGFVFAQQLYPEVKEHLPFTNALVLVGMNPFRATNDQVLTEQFKAKNVPQIGDDGAIKLSDFIPGLTRYFKASEDKYVEWLNMTWVSTLHEIGDKVVDIALLNTTNEKIFKDRGSMSLEKLTSNMLEYGATFDYHIYTTGLIKELYHELIKSDYEEYAVKGEHPYHGDMEHWAIDTIASHYTFFEFLHRMHTTIEEEFGVDDEPFEK